MKCFVVAALCLAVAVAQRTPPQNNPPPPSLPSSSASSSDSSAPPEVNWGKCPQLEPTLDEQRQKGAVIEKCLEKHPLPESSPSQEEIETHRETITTCALKAEGWFNSDGTYKFERAGKEIEGKNLKVAPEILSKHAACTQEAKENFPDRNIQQVQLYQACMDYHITKICDIKISTPEGSSSQE